MKTGSDSTSKSREALSRRHGGRAPSSFAAFADPVGVVPQRNGNRRIPCLQSHLCCTGTATVGMILNLAPTMGFLSTSLHLRPRHGTRSLMLLT